MAPNVTLSSLRTARAPYAQARSLCTHSAALPHRWQRQRRNVAIVTRSAGDEAAPDLLADLPEPDTCRGAIALGLKLTEAGQWARAQEYFERSLELPGTGVKRFRDKPAAPSNGEKCSALYNIACCQAQLGQPENVQNGLIALAGCLEAGYDDFRQLRTDPDIAALRASDKFEGLMKRFERRGGFMSVFDNL